MVADHSWSGGASGGVGQLARNDKVAKRGRGKCLRKRDGRKGSRAWASLNCRIRIARVSRVRRQAGRLAATFPRAHGEALREAWNKKCGVLGAAGRAAQRQDADLYPGASKSWSIQAGKPRRRIGRRSAMIQSGRARGTSPKRTGSWWRKWIRRSWR